MSKISSPILLEEPIIRGTGDAAQKIESIQIRNPGAGELRGINLESLVHMNVDDIITILPRISVPPISDLEAANLSGGDLIDVGYELTSFFNQRRSMRAAAEKKAQKEQLKSEA